MELSWVTEEVSWTLLEQQSGILQRRGKGIVAINTVVFRQLGRLGCEIAIALAEESGWFDG